jgi:hypothetical protein
LIYINKSDAFMIQCSSTSPWGIHPAVVANVCTRCGWVAREPKLGGRGERRRSRVEASRVT